MTKRKALTEEQWLGADNPRMLLSDLRQHRVITRVPGGRRRLALVACACCRLVWHLFDDERGRRAVEVSERAAEGQVSRQELSAAEEEAEAFYRERERGSRAVARDLSSSHRWQALARTSLAQAARSAASRRFSVQCASLAAGSTASAVLWLAEGKPGGNEARRALMARQAQLVRCLFGNPFRPLPQIDAAWLSGNGGAVRKLAASIQAERRFGDLPVLADALEEAGCGDADLLAHCRAGGEHALGCWALDLLLGKGEGLAFIE